MTFREQCGEFERNVCPGCGNLNRTIFKSLNSPGVAEAALLKFPYELIAPLYIF